MALFDSSDDVKSALMLYSTLIDNASEEDRASMYELLKDAVKRIDPEFELNNELPLTAYEVFNIVCGLEEHAEVAPLLDVEGYEGQTIDYMTWDPDTPADDTDQFPDYDNVPTK